MANALYVIGISTLGWIIGAMLDIGCLYLAIKHKDEGKVKLSKLNYSFMVFGEYLIRFSLFVFFVAVGVLVLEIVKSIF